MHILFLAYQQLSSCLFFSQVVKVTGGVLSTSSICLHCRPKSRFDLIKFYNTYIFVLDVGDPHRLLYHLLNSNRYVAEFIITSWFVYLIVNNYTLLITARTFSVAAVCTSSANLLIYSFK